MIKIIVIVVKNLYLNPFLIYRYYKYFLKIDCRRGQSLVVWAISEGRLAAKEIDLALMGETGLPGSGGIIIGVSA